MKEVIRYDSNRVRLRSGEYERSNGHYEYRYSVYGKQFSVYARTLEELREKEKQIISKKEADRAKYNQYRTTLNDVFELWKELKRGIRDNTYCSYCYAYEQYVKGSIGEWYISTIKKSDVKRFFNYLAAERRLKAGTIDGVQTILHQVLRIAADDEWIEHNPADNATKEIKRVYKLRNKKRLALTKKEQEFLIKFLLENYYAKGERCCEYAINDTKTPASKRFIPMTKQVKEAFLMEKDMQEQMVNYASR